MALRGCGLVPPPEEGLRRPAVRAGWLPHAAAATGRAAGRAGIWPAAMRASQARPVVTTAHSQRKMVAAQAVRACPSVSWFWFRLVQRSYLPASTRLWRSAPHTARQAAVRRPGRPRREIRVLPVIVAEVCSDGLSPACLTTARPEANRVRSPVSARITAPDRADIPSMLATSPARPRSASMPVISASVAASRPRSDRQSSSSRCSRSSAPRRCAATPAVPVSASQTFRTMLCRTILPSQRGSSRRTAARNLS